MIPPETRGHPRAAAPLAGRPITDLLTALGLLLVIEGALYALFPGGMKRLLAQALTLEPTALRIGGLAAVAAGFLLTWAMRAGG